MKTRDTSETILDVRGHLTPLPRVHYIHHPFYISNNVSKVRLLLSFHKKNLAQIFLSLHDPQNFRGNRMNPGAKGDICLELWVSSDDASEGALPGILPEGEWQAQIDIERLGEEVDYRLQVIIEREQIAEPFSYTYPEHHVVRPDQGWYKGELHSHSTESDGKFLVNEVIEAAQNIGLDFLSLTDHFTTSHWRKMAPLANGSIALIRGSEITSHQGHANLHGIQSWVDVYVDRPDWSMRQAAEQVRRQGGLFCVNHPYSGDLSWRPADFDWALADLIEIYHNLEGANNDYQAPLWDRLLADGYHLVGIAGTDSHDPYKGTHALGQLVTWVFADELSEKGILEGLRRGRVYLSRGPELRFYATRENEQTAEMWESLPLGDQPVSFHLDLKLDRPARAFVFKNGYYFESFVINPQIEDWQTYQFQDQPDQDSFYRVELHEIVQKDQYPGIWWRDYSTMLAMTNPIFIGQAKDNQ